MLQWPSICFVCALFFWLTISTKVMSTKKWLTYENLVFEVAFHFFIFWENLVLYLRYSFFYISNHSINFDSHDLLMGINNEGKYIFEYIFWIIYVIWLWRFTIISQICGYQQKCKWLDKCNYLYCDLKEYTVFTLKEYTEYTVD